ncbi:MAG: site-specific DNA-methyltransferase, partial [Candidatus Caldarchaeum sp.]|nr:site-specific DNA-methyltransferase [Candidatus Caldarchaeum sp.]
FKDLELQILALFDDLDESLDGWLIKSENYQALNTILPKWQGKVQCIYIDPPFNKEGEADYLYSVRYKDSTWVSLIENRILLAKELLHPRGGLFLRCDKNGNSYARLLLDMTFGEENFRNEIVLNRFQKASEGFTNTTECLFFYSASTETSVNVLKRPRQCVYCKQPQPPKWTWAHSAGENKEPRYFTIIGQRVLLYPPKGRHWSNRQEEIDRLEQAGRIRIRRGRYIDVLGQTQCFIPEKLQSEEVEIDDNWTDIPGYEFGVFSKWKFATENSETLLKRVLEAQSSPREIVCDFFLGSGTTVAVAHKMRRRWIGVELGNHFHTVVLRRMKKVLFYDDSGISEEGSVRESYNAECAGGFFKYYELEQFEDTLRRTRYADDEPITFGDPLRYLFLRDAKLSDAL